MKTENKPLVFKCMFCKRNKVDPWSRSIICKPCLKLILDFLDNKYSFGSKVISLELFSCRMGLGSFYPDRYLFNLSSNEKDYIRKLRKELKIRQ
jgi:hypothetical protein